MPDSTRLIYIGLWMEADDMGCLRYDVTEIAADLYPYLDRVAREARLTLAVNELTIAGRLKVPGCGHAFIPTLVRHQRFAQETKRVVMYQKEHESGCSVAGVRGDPRLPATVPDGPEPSPTIPDESRVVAGSRYGKERKGEGRFVKERGVSRAREMTPINEMTTTRRTKVPEDEEIIVKCRAILADPDATEWRKSAAKDQLTVMGVPA